MENQNNSNQNCGCSEGCCPSQKKRNLWTKVTFGVIILAAAVIITIKLTGKHDASTKDCCEPTESSNCC